MRWKKFMTEAAINVDMSEINALIKQIKTFPQNGFLNKINKVFNPYEIYFFETKEDTTDGIGKASIVTYNDATAMKIFINSKEIRELIVNGDFAIFAQELSATIEHELIHKNQIEKVNAENKTTVLSRGQSKEGLKAYLSNEHELMAYANTIIRTLEKAGFNQEEILDMFKGGNLTPYKASEWSPDLKRYQEVFKDDPKVLKKLYKYIYVYALGDSNEA